MRRRSKIISIFMVLAMALCGLFANVKMPIAQADNTINLTIEAKNVSYSDSLYIVYAVSAEGVDTDASAVKMLFWNENQDSYELGTESYQVSAQRQTVSLNQKDCLVFYSSGIAAKNMTDDIYSRAYVEVDGTAYYSAVQKFSVLEYAHLMLERDVDGDDSNDLSIEQKNLMNALLRYGAAAQKLFEYNTDRLANAKYYKIEVVGGLLSDGFTSGRYNAEETVTITADAPADDQEFLHWLDSYGNVVSTNMTYDVTMPTEDMKFTAVYQIVDNNDYILQVVNGTFGDGQTSGTYKSGNKIIITANTPDEGMEFSHWEDADGNVASTESVYEVTIAHADATYTAIYKKITSKWEDSNNVFPFPVEWAGIERGEASATALSATSLMSIPRAKAFTSQVESAINLTIKEKNVSYSDSLYIVYAVSTEGFDTATSAVKMLFWNELQDSYELGTESYQASAQKDTVSVNGVDCLAFYSNGIAAKNMTDNIYARACVEIDGTVYYSAVQKFSILEYAHLMLEKNSDGDDNNDLTEAQTELMDALLEYGAAAQALFGYNTDRLANDTYYSVKVENGLMSDGFTSGRYLSGETVTITANEPEEGYRFSHWEDANGNLISEQSVYELAVQASAQYTAVYELKPVVGDVVLSQTGELMYGQSADKLDLPKTITFEYDGETIELAVVWKAQDFDSHVIGEQNIYATLVDTSAYAEYGVQDIYMTVNVLDYSLEYNSTTQTYSFTGYYGDESEYQVPSSYNEIAIVEIAESAFAYNTVITSVTIPASVTSIEDNAFFNCTLLESVTFGESSQLTSIGSYAFSGCMSLETIEFPESVTSIDSGAFANCSSLASVTIPESVTSIGSYAFEKCTSLEVIEIPASVTSMGENVFYNCNSLQTIYCGVIQKPSGWDNNWNAYCSAEVVWEDGLEFALINNGTEYSVTGYTGTNGEVVIPAEYEDKPVTNIGTNAFANSTVITSIVIPSSVTLISSGAFNNCSSLVKVNFLGTIDEWAEIELENTFASPTRMAKCLYINNELVTEVKLTTATKVNPLIFYQCETITSVEISNSVKSIGNYAFRSCTALTSVEMLGGVQTIGQYTFDGCTLLESVVLSNDLTRIESRSFQGCTALSSIEIPESVTSIGEYVFQNCSSLTSIVIPDSVEAIGQYAFLNCTLLESVKLPNGLTSLESHLFQNCTALKSIEIPRSVTNIADLVFYNTTSLTSIYIPISVETMITVNSSGTLCGVISGCSSLSMIYCEADSAPSGWATRWNYNSKPVTWGYANLINNAVSAISAIGKVTPNSADLIIEARTAYDALEIDIARNLVTNYDVLVKAEQEFEFISQEFEAWKEQVDTLYLSEIISATDIEEVNAVESIYNGWVNSSDVRLNNLAITVANGGSTYSYDKYLGLIEDRDALLSVLSNLAQDMSNISIDTDEISLAPISFNNTVKALKNRFEALDSSLKLAYFEYYGAEYKSAYDNYAIALALYNNVYSLVENIINLGDPTKVTLSQYYTINNYVAQYEALSEEYQTIIIAGGFKDRLYTAKETVDVIKEESSGGIYYQLINNTAYEVIDYKGGAKEVEIPSIYLDLPVISIGEKAFDGNTTIINIILPNSVTNIGYAAFNNCTNLKTITLGSGIIAISDYAFYGCKSLSSISLPSTLTSIGEYAFYSCKSLTSITIPSATTSVGERAFTYCSSLTINCQVASEPSDWSTSWNSTNRPVVWNCSSNSMDADGYIYTMQNDIKYAIKDGVATVTEQPQALTEITILSSITYNDRTYAVTSIDARAFYGSALTSIEIPASVASIGDYAFYNCDSLISITIPSSVKAIGKYAFSQCDKLASVSLPTNVESIGSYAFRGCGKLTYTVENGLKYLGNNANPYIYLAEITDNTIATATINSNCRVVGSYVFSEADCLTSAEVPASVVYMGHEVFYKAYALTIKCQSASQPTGFESDWNYAKSPVVWDCAKNEVADDGYIYAVVGGVRYALNDITGKATVVRQPQNLTSAIILESVSYKGSTCIVNKIDNNAFYNCSSLTSVSLPNSLEYVGAYVFEGCNLSYNKSGNLYYLGNSSKPYLYLATTDAVTITNPSINANCKFIGDSAFVNAKSLTYITIPASIRNIGASAFSGRSSLRTVTFEQGSQLQTISNSAFYGCSGLTSIVIPDSVEIIGASAFKSCVNLTSITLPSSLTSIEAFVFEGCTKLASVHIPGNVQYIDYFAFNGCTALTTVAFDDDSEMTYIGDCAFLGCAKLFEIAIPDSVTDMGIKVFKDCKALTYVTLSSSLTKVNDYEFLNCTSLLEITIPSSVTEICISAFEGCSALTELTFEANSALETIGTYAFASCSSLLAVEIPASVKTIGSYAFTQCTSLSTVTLNEGLISMGIYAFSYTAITNIIIPASVETLDFGIFVGCDTSIVINCRISSPRPAGWQASWNYLGSMYAKVNWSYTGN